MPAMPIQHILGLRPEVCTLISLLVPVSCPCNPFQFGLSQATALMLISDALFCVVVDMSDMRFAWLLQVASSLCQLVTLLVLEREIS